MATKPLTQTTGRRKEAVARARLRPGTGVHTINGKDKKFVPADAVIRDGAVFVSATGVPSPAYVRYAWANAPLEANLYNIEGFPAVPFRTDQ